MPMPGIKASDAFDTSWDPGPPQHEGEPDMPSQEHNDEESTPSRMLCCDKCGSPVSLFRFRYHCGRCGPTTCTVSESQLGRRVCGSPDTRRAKSSHHHGTGPSQNARSIIRPWTFPYKGPCSR